MIIYVLCGLPASGKTTLSSVLSRKYDAKLYCYDDAKLSRSKLYEKIKDDLITNNVVLDDLMLTKTLREKLLHSIEDIACRKVLVVLETPVDVCVQRNRSRKSNGHPSDSTIRHLASRYQKPSYEEGWDDIQYI